MKVNMTSVIYIEEEDVGSVWLKALRRVLEEGDDISTEYDKEGDPPSKDLKFSLSYREERRRKDILNKIKEGEPISDDEIIKTFK